MKKATRIRQHGRAVSECSSSEAHGLLLQVALNFLRKVSREPLNSTLTYFTTDHSAGTLELNHMCRIAGPPHGLPDCVKFFLGKGPKFVPRHAKWPDASKFACAIQEFKRKFFCAAHFADRDSVDLSHVSQKMTRIRCPSRWWPPTPTSAAQIFSSFEEEVWNRFRRCWAQHKPTSNLSCIDRIALQWLRMHGFTVIKDDKGTALIPVKVSFLANLKSEICSDQSQFEKSICDRAVLGKQLAGIIGNLCDKYTPKSTREALVHQIDASWRLMEISLTWKSHKVVQVPRTITPTSSSILTPMAQYVRIRLSEIVSNLPHVIRNSADLVFQLEQLVLPDACTLGSGDIKDFYPSTTPEMAAKCICTALYEAGCDDAVAVADLAYVILRHQFVTVNGESYRCCRVGQGLAFASEACDLTAALLIERHPKFIPFLDVALFYGRFRDDIVVVLPCSIGADLQTEFAAAFNECTKEYHAKFEWSDSYIDALDLHICRSGAAIHCSTFFKPTNLFRYLPMHSNHQHRVFISWIRAEVRRYIVTNSCCVDFLATVTAFKDRLKLCGYDPKTIEEGCSDALDQYELRSSFLKPSKGRNSGRIIAFILPYDPFFVKMGIRRLVAGLGVDFCKVANLPSHFNLRTLVAFSTDQCLLHALRRLPLTMKCLN